VQLHGIQISTVRRKVSISSRSHNRPMPIDISCIIDKRSTPIRTPRGNVINGEDSRENYIRTKKLNGHGPESRR